MGREREMTVYYVELYAEFKEQVITALVQKHMIQQVTFDRDGYMTISDLIPKSLNKKIILAAVTWNEAIGDARDKLQKLVIELGKNESP
jgi:hypothetical protein